MALSKITTASLADDSVTGAKIENNPTVAGNLTVSGSFAPSTTTSGKNMIMNGAMRIHQRVATLTHNDKAVDRFQLTKNNLVTADFTTRHYVAGEAEVREFGGDSVEIKCTTADTSLASNEVVRLRHPIEAQYVRRLAYGTANAKTTILSFWVYTNVTGTYAVNFTAMDGTVRNISKTYTVSQANQWVKYSITIPGDTSATIDNDNGEGFEINWGLAAGSGWTGTNPNGAWANNTDSRNYYGQTVNIASAVNNVWYLTGVQWEEGSVATEFEQETIGETLRKCQRYYQQLMTSGQGYTTGSQHIGINMRYLVEMRAAATVTLAYDGGDQYNNLTGSPTVHRNRTDGFHAYQSANSGNYYYYYIGTSDAEI